MEIQEINKAIQHLSQEPATQEHKVLSTGDPVLFKALQGQQIRHMTDNTRIENALKYAMSISGIRASNLPSPEEKGIILSFIRRNFGGHTSSELYLAFDMAVAGKLDVDAVAYENFSCEYISRIMTAYRQWAAEEKKQIIMPKVEQKQLNEGEVDWTDQWNTCIAHAAIDALNELYIPTDIYDWLEKRGEINLSPVQKWEYMDKAARKYLQDMQQGVHSGIPVNEFRRVMNLLNNGGWKKDYYVGITVRNMAKVLIIKNMAIEKAKNIIPTINDIGNNEQGNI
jgi:hypothetical protein